MATYGLERFSEFDNQNGLAAVPTTATSVNVAVGNLNTTDIILEYDFIFKFAGTINNANPAPVASTYFPYNTVQNIKIPYQSNSVAAVNMPGELAWVISLLRKNNRPYQNPVTLGDQKAVLSTGFSPEALQDTPGALTNNAANTWRFRLKVPVSIWFRRFYDYDQSNKLGAIDDVWVSPLFMQSVGRNITPVLQLAPIFGAANTGNSSPAQQVGAITTAATWTDSGSTVTVRRNGWRQPGPGAPLPPAFSWAYNWTVDTVNFAGTPKINYTFPLNGQLLAVVVMMYDPTLGASNPGQGIPLANIVTATLQYGSGVIKYQDNPITLQDRMLDQHGVIPFTGLFWWDMYYDTRSNLDGINTYNTAAVRMLLDLTGNTPGAGSFCLVASEWLTAVG